MPLVKSSSKRAVSENIRREISAGKPKKQAVAIALDVQRRNKATGGALGVLPSSAVGSFNVSKTSKTPESWQQKSLIRHVTRGPILSSVPGRTDAHKTHVPSGSYVVPADIVSGRGQGNTIAGTESLSKLFKLGPYGSSVGKLKATKPKFKATGGSASDSTIGQPVRVNLAGGEIVIPPENLMETVHPDLNTAHDIMDRWVLMERKNLRKVLASLPGPVKD